MRRKRVNARVHVHMCVCVCVCVCIYICTYIHTYIHIYTCIYMCIHVLICTPRLAVGCIWAFGGFVPEACVNGELGDNFAYNTMWCVRAAPCC